MNQVEATRLLNVATALRQARNPANFTMGRYGYKNPDLSASSSCGTPACALGHYAFRRDLQRAFQLNEGELATSSGQWIDFGEYKVLEHFGINGSESFDLFSARGCDNAKTAIQAAIYIEKFLDRKGWVAA